MNHWNWGSFTAGIVAAEWAFALVLWLGIGIGTRRANREAARWTAEKTTELNKIKRDMEDARDPYSG